MEVISSYFWSEKFWFPAGGLGWKDFENHPGGEGYLPQYSDMLWSIPVGLLLLAFRFVFERGFVVHVARWLGVKEKKRLLKPQPALEAWYRQNGAISNNNLESVAKQTDLSIREIERWLRDRKALSKPCDIKKFQECSWHFVFYISSFTGGLYVLWNKSYFWKTELCWKNWPKIYIDNDVYWYYLLELSFYWCLVFSMVTDHRRKDFGQMIVHHIATILLIYFSWVANFVPVGTLTMLTHDAADFPMAAAKMFKYSGYKNTCQACFAVFVVVWILSRLMYYPFVVLYCASVEVYLHIDSFGSYYFFNGLLIVLQILHFIWTYYIAKIVYNQLFEGKVEDLRSDTESD